jgi:hypothetical protein
MSYVATLMRIQSAFENAYGQDKPQHCAEKPRSAR